MTVAEAKTAVEVLRAKFPAVGPYKLAKEIHNGGDGRVGDTYPIYEALGDEGSFYRILNYIRRYDAQRQKAKFAREAEVLSTV